MREEDEDKEEEENNDRQEEQKNLWLWWSGRKNVKRRTWGIFQKCKRNEMYQSLSTTLK